MRTRPKRAASFGKTASRNKALKPARGPRIMEVKEIAKSNHCSPGWLHENWHGTRSAVRVLQLCIESRADIACWLQFVSVLVACVFLDERLTQQVKRAGLSKGRTFHRRPRRKSDR